MAVDGWLPVVGTGTDTGAGGNQRSNGHQCRSGIRSGLLQFFGMGRAFQCGKQRGIT